MPQPTGRQATKHNAIPASNIGYKVDLDILNPPVHTSSAPPSRKISQTVVSRAAWKWNFIPPICFSIAAITAVGRMCSQQQKCDSHMWQLKSSQYNRIGVFSTSATYYPRDRCTFSKQLVKKVGKLIVRIMLYQDFHYHQSCDFRYLLQMLKAAGWKEDTGLGVEEQVWVYCYPIIVAPPPIQRQYSVFHAMAPFSPWLSADCLQGTTNLITIINNMIKCFQKSCMRQVEKR